MSTGAFLHPFAAVDRPRSEFTTIVRGEGCYLFDSRGRRYLELMGSLWFNNVGYGRREIADAIAEAASSLGSFHCFDKYTNEPAEQLAERIVRLHPDSGSRVFFTSSGSESVDSAIKISRLAHHRSGHPERTLIVFRDRAYHGVALGGTSASGLPPNREGFGPLGHDFVQVPPDDLDALAEMLDECGDRVAAVFAEPVQGAAGVFPPVEGYLAGLRELCDRHGAHLVFDEVITGFGRLGTWFAAQRFDVIPDLTTFAKAISSGYVPLGGVIVAPSVVDALASEPGALLRTGHTYSGHHVAAAAGMANLDIIEKEGLVARAAEIEGVLGPALRGLEANGTLAVVRGIGAMWGAQLPDGLDPVAVRDALEDHGILVRSIGSTVCFCPPLVVTDDELLGAVATFAEVVTSTVQLCPTR